MHLAFITNLYPPYVVGGNELLCHEVIGALRARGHRVSVLCGRGRRLPSHPDLAGALELDLDRMDETFLGGRLPTAAEAVRLHLVSPGSHRATRRFLAERRPDVVVVWNLYLASLSPLVAANESGRPVVVHVCDKWLHHGLYDLASLLRPVVAWKRAALWLAKRTLQPIVRQRAMPRRLIAISEFIKAFYARAGLAASIEVVHLGVPTREFAFTPRPPRAPGAPLKLLFVGALWEGKGPQTAVRALAQLRREGVAARLDVLGGGAPGFVDFLRRVVAEEGLDDAVKLHGRVAREVVRDHCRSHDVLVFPSRWDEPFAAVPVEAMSCGMAVVATTAGGTREAIEDGVSGLLVPPDDPGALARALRRLADDDGLRRRLGERAAAVARERFDLDRYVERLEAAYRACLDADATRGG